MSLPVYKQYVLPPVNVPAGVLQIRINAHGDFAYLQSGADTLYLTYPEGFPPVITVASLKKAFNDKDVSLTVDSLKFRVYDIVATAYSGRVGDPNTGTVVSETLTNNDSLFDKIFSIADEDLTGKTQPVIWGTLFSAAGQEPFFVGTCNTFQIPRDHLSVFGTPDTTSEIQTRELEINATDIMAQLKVKTVQNFADSYGGLVTEYPNWYLGMLYVLGGTIFKQFSTDVGLTTAGIPTGMQGMTIKDLLEVVVATVGIDGSTLTIDSSFDYYLQAYNSGLGTYPLIGPQSSLETLLVQFNHLFGFAVQELPVRIITGVNTTTDVISTAPIYHGFNNGDFVTFTTSGTLPAPLSLASNYYIVGATDQTFQVSLTLGGAAINLTTTGTGTSFVKYANDDFVYTNMLPRALTLNEVIKKFSYQFGCVFYNDIQISHGVYLPVLKSIALRSKYANIPTTWNLISSKEEPHYIAATSVTVQNEFDNLKLQAGTDTSQNLDIIIPFRVHQWGLQQKNSDAIDNLVPDQALWFDQSLGKYEQDKCFRNVDNGLNYADGWVQGRFLYSPIANDLNIYHTPGWTSGTPAAIGAAAMTVAGYPLPNDNDGYYNSLKAAAIFYYQQFCGQKIVLTRKYDGVTNDAGSVQGVRPGLEVTLPIREISNGNAPRVFRAIETNQDLIRNTTECKFFEHYSDPTTLPIPPLTYVGQAGGTSSNSSSNSSTGSNSGSGSLDNNQFVSTVPSTATRNDIIPTAAAFPALNVKGQFAGKPISVTLVNGQNDDVDITSSGITYSDIVATGPTAAFSITGFINGTDGAKIFLRNATSFDLTLKDNIGSASNDQIRTPGALDYVIPANGGCTLRYESSDTKWHVLEAGVGSDLHDIVDNPSATQTIQPITNGAIALVLKKKTGNSADIWEVQDDSGNVLHSVDSNGLFNFFKNLLLTGSNTKIGLDTGSGISFGTTGQPLISQGTSATPKWATVADLVSFLAGKYVLIDPTGNQVILSTTTPDVMLGLQARTGDTANQVIFYVANALGVTQLQIRTGGGIEMKGPLRLGDAGVGSYLRSDTITVDIAPYLVGLNIVDLPISTARCVKLTDSTGNTNKNYNLCGFTNGVDGRELIITLDTVFTVNANFVFSSGSNVAETTAANQIAGLQNILFKESASFRYDTTNDSQTGLPLDKWQLIAIVQ